MACRKAAYRAETELSEWMEQQHEKAEQQNAQLQQAQQKIWTPPSIFEKCCPKWLADGAEILGVGRQQYQSAGGGLYGRGCSGGCGKDHPRITLEYEYNNNNNNIMNDNDNGVVSGSGQAVVFLSHDLDPFVRYFEELCQKGLARKKTNYIYNKNNNKDKQACSRCYYLEGFLQSHLDKMKQQSDKTGFGPHLIKVSATALAKSKRAHQQQTEQQEIFEHEQQKAKRRRIIMAQQRKQQGDSNNNNTVATNNHFNYNNYNDLLECVFEICYQNGCLQEHLNIADIAWMRLTGHPTLVRYAARMAKARLEQIQISYSILLNGEYVPGSEDEDDYQEGNGDCSEGNVMSAVQNSLNLQHDKYTVESSRQPMRFESSAAVPAVGTSSSSRSEIITGTSRFVPEEVHEVVWNSRWMHMGRERAYRGHMIRVYLEGTSSTSISATTTTTTITTGGGSGGGNNDDNASNSNSKNNNNHVNDNTPERDCLFRSSCLPLEIARHSIHPREVQVGTHTKSSGLTFQVTRAQEEQREVHGDEHGGFNDGIHAQYSGSFSVQGVKFTFGDLLGIYVRKKLPLEKQKFQEIRSKRPATRLEKEYVKALAKEAREAPGRSAWAYRGMAGW